ncbi:MAG TPA: hypothetical protein VF495_07305 [Phenylobacterium sp.]|jgi:hypothetical protein
MVQRDVRSPAIDPALIGEADRPENDWGEPEPGAVHGVNHTRRGEAADGYQGRKTRTATKDQISRRG